MAKRYARLNWQNAPSVATPMNATNLNKMDKGIDDLDNAIEAIYSKRVNNVVTTNEDTFLAGPVGKVLQDQVTELNKNIKENYLVKNGKAFLNGEYDLNTFRDSGRWTLGTISNIANAPDTGTLIVSNCGTYIKQEVTTFNTGFIYTRISADEGTSWNKWYRFTGTQVGT
jgi:hypothetical protein